MKESIMPLEMAEQEFDAFCDEMDIDNSVEGLDDEDKKDFLGLKKKLTGAIMAGRLTFSEANEPILKTHDGQSIKFEEPTGGSLMASDKRGKNENIARMNMIMSEMTGTSPKTFANMKSRDYKVATAITTLFLV